MTQRNKEWKSLPVQALDARPVRPCLTWESHGEDGKPLQAIAMVHAPASECHPQEAAMNGKCLYLSLDGKIAPTRPLVKTHRDRPLDYVGAERWKYPRGSRYPVCQRDLDELNDQLEREGLETVDDLDDAEDLIDRDELPDAMMETRQERKVKRAATACNRRGMPESHPLHELYKDCKEVWEGRVGQEVRLQQGKFELLPGVYPQGKLKRDIMHAAGSEGAGKTTFIANFIRHWVQQRQQEGRPCRVVLFSLVENDPALRDLNPIRINIDSQLVDKPIDPLRELGESMVVFDDIESIADKNVAKALQQLRDKCIEVGRHNNVWVCSTSHPICNSQKSAAILREATAICFFPGSGGLAGIHRYLETYCGFSKTTIKRIMAISGRWVCVYQRAPTIVASEHSVFLVDHSK